METSAPVQQKERIFILDVTRGIALCGILILNIGFFGRPFQTGFNLNIFQETSFPNILSWYATNFVFEGSFRGLFSMLFGAGSILIISRLSKDSTGLLPADVYYRRLIWLLLFGLINAHILLWPGDILYTYAICGFFIFPMRNLSPRVLSSIAIFFMLLIMLAGWFSTKGRIEMRDKGLKALAIKEAKKDSLTEEQKGELGEWRGYLERRKIENAKKEADKEIKAMTATSYSQVWSHLRPINIKLETTIFYKEFFFDAIIFILLGMAFYKMGILTGEKPTWVYVAFIIFGYSLGVGWGYVAGHTWRQADYDFFEFIKLQSPNWMLLYQPHRLFISLGHLGVIMVLWKSNVFNWLLTPFAKLGQMAFTNYLGQSIICTLFFYGYGFGYFGKFERYELWYVVASVWVFQLIFSTLWMKFFSMGPLEWVWRSLTYWSIQSIKK